MMWAVRVCVWIVLIFQARIGCLLCCCLTSLTALAGWTQWWPLCQNLYNYPPNLWEFCPNLWEVWPYLWEVCPYLWEVCPYLSEVCPYLSEVWCVSNTCIFTANLRPSNLAQTSERFAHTSERFVRTSERLCPCLWEVCPYLWEVRPWPLRGFGGRCFGVWFRGVFWLVVSTDMGSFGLIRSISNRHFMT